MSDATPAEDNASVGAAAPRPGRVLAEARENRKLSVADAALQLKLSVSQIEALEADAYDRLPGAVFVRGFVRNYARLLDLDGDALVESLDLESKGMSAMAAVPRSHNIPFPARGKVRWPAYLAILLLIIVAVVLADLLISAPPVVVVQPPVVKSATVAAPVPEQPVAAPEKGVPVAEPASATMQQPEPSTAAKVIPPEVTAPKSLEQGELHFAFDNESWVEVRDRNNRILMSQLNQAGTEHRIQGRPPFALVVGNARGVRLKLNGKSIDLAHHTKVEVARLTLE